MVVTSSSDSPARVVTPSLRICKAGACDGREYQWMTIRFTAPDGLRWEVIELNPESRFADLPARASKRPTLYFLSRQSTRRSLQYPADWRLMSASALARLCDESVPLSREDGPADGTARGSGHPPSGGERSAMPEPRDHS
jgi:hypothetical protein